MRSALAFFLLALAPLLAATPNPGRLERDLGQGLAYVRLRELPADLPRAPTRTGAMVLDLRYTHGDQAAPAALGAWLQFRCTARTPVLLLVNAATAPALLDYLEATDPLPGLVTLGPASSRFVPDLPLKIPPATELAAYTALDHGTPVTTLLTDQPDKPRHDEAAIALEHTVAPVTTDESTGLSDVPATAPLVPVPPPSLIDETLQRAVHLHRALLALKKI
jgi:hypothetical protein